MPDRWQALHEILQNSNAAETYQSFTHCVHCYSQKHETKRVSNWQCMTSYWCSIATLGLGGTVVEVISH